jgi:CSLREA domain-containing protein
VPGRRLWIAVIAAAVCLGFAPAALADLFAVTKRGDHMPGLCTKPDCTLREAIRAANINPGPDRIILPSHGTYNLFRDGAPDDDAFRGDLDITTDPLRIFHAGAGRATIDANGIDRVFEIFVGAPTHLVKLKITGGDFPSSGSGDGGGIRTSANLWLDHSLLNDNHARGVNGNGGGLQALGGKLWILQSTIADNVAADSSGALDIGNHGVTIQNSTIAGNRAIFAGASYMYGDGEVTISRSTIAGNRSTSETGGIYFSESAGTLFVSRSTFSGNVAATDGGGLSARNGDVQVVDSTFAGNRAGGNGGGIWALTPLRLNAVTIARNVADADSSGSETGAGLYGETVGSGVRIRNSIVAANRLGNGTRNDCAGDPFTSLGHNLLSTKGPVSVCAGFDEPSDLVSKHPGLDDLHQNGGGTKTIALRSGSPAIGHADPNTAPGRDQRGVKRHDPDIGAFERR